MPSVSPALIRSGVKSHRTIRIHGEINHAGVFIDEEHVVPGFAAVSGFEHTTLFVWSPQVTQHSRVDNVRIARIDNYAANMFGVAQSHVLPGLAGVQ